MTDLAELNKKLVEVANKAAEHDHARNVQYGLNLFNQEVFNNTYWQRMRELNGEVSA